MDETLMLLRLECLAQSVKSISAGFDEDIVRRAQRFFDFVNGGAPQEKVREESYSIKDVADEIPF